jgi:hypothetical protein
MTTGSAPTSAGNNGKAWVTVSSGQSPFTYSWNDPAGQTTDTAVNLAPGNYTVIVTDLNNCINSRTVEVLNGTGGGGTGLSAIHPFADRVSLYPNPLPAGQDLWLDIDFDAPVRMEIEVWDLVGVKLWSQAHESNQPLKQVLNFGAWNSGIYFIRFLIGENEIVKKLVVRN